MPRHRLGALTWAIYQVERRHCTICKHPYSVLQSLGRHRYELVEMVKRARADDVSSEMILEGSIPDFAV